MSSRLHTLIHKDLKLQIRKTFFWPDSMTTLQYIKNERRRFRPFAANRLSEIYDVSSPTVWRYVPGDVNPADNGSNMLSKLRVVGGAKLPFFGSLKNAGQLNM